MAKCGVKPTHAVQWLVARVKKALAMTCPSRRCASTAFQQEQEEQWELEEQEMEDLFFGGEEEEEEEDSDHALRMRQQLEQALRMHEKELEVKELRAGIGRQTKEMDKLVGQLGNTREMLEQLAEADQLQRAHNDRVAQSHT